MKKILLILALLPALTLTAQSIHPVTARPVSSLRLPWGLSNLSVVDGRLYASQSGVLVSAATTNGTITGLLPDTLFGPLCDGADYIIRNNRDSLLYFSRPTESSSYDFNKHTNSRFRKNRRVDIRAWFKDVSHPTFSPDGNTLIFAAKGKVGLGGYDLWYSFYNGTRWSKPINLGNVINTPGNEMYPVFYGDYLIFASDGVAGAPHGFNLYSVKLKSGTKVDDIIFANYIVQPLPAPFNSNGDDWEIAFDTAANKGYWMSTRNGKEELFTFQGQLEGVMLKGKVTDEKGLPVPQAEIKLLSNGHFVADATTDASGNYNLFALPGDDYTLTVSKTNYFLFENDLTLLRLNEDLLVATQYRNVTLASLPFGRPLIFDNLYQSETEVELSSDAQASLRDIINYLRVNPNVLVQFTLYCTQSDDASYNNLVIERRISNMRRFLESCLPTNSQLSFKNGNLNPEKPTGDYKGNEVFVELFSK